MDAGELVLRRQNRAVFVDALRRRLRNKPPFFPGTKKEYDPYYYDARNGALDFTQDELCQIVPELGCGTKVVPSPPAPPVVPPDYSYFVAATLTGDANWMYDVLTGEEFKTAYDTGIQKSVYTQGLTLYTRGKGFIWVFHTPSHEKYFLYCFDTNGKSLYDFEIDSTGDPITGVFSVAHETTNLFLLTYRTTGNDGGYVYYNFATGVAYTEASFGESTINSMETLNSVDNTASFLYGLSTGEQYYYKIMDDVQPDLNTPFIEGKSIVNEYNAQRGEYAFFGKGLTGSIYTFVGYLDNEGNYTEFDISSENCSAVAEYICYTSSVASGQPIKGFAMFDSTNKSLWRFDFGSSPVSLTKLSIPSYTSLNFNSFENNLGRSYYGYTELLAYAEVQRAGPVRDVYLLNTGTKFANGLTVSTSSIHASPSQIYIHYTASGNLKVVSASSTGTQTYTMKNPAGVDLSSATFVFTELYYTLNYIIITVSNSSGTRYMTGIKSDMSASSGSIAIPDGLEVGDSVYDLQDIFYAVFANGQGKTYNPATNAFVVQQANIDTYEQSMPYGNVIIGLNGSSQQFYMFAGAATATFGAVITPSDFTGANGMFIMPNESYTGTNPIVTIIPTDASGNSTYIESTTGYTNPVVHFTDTTALVCFEGLTATERILYQYVSDTGVITKYTYDTANFILESNYGPSVLI